MFAPEKLFEVLLDHPSLGLMIIQDGRVVFVNNYICEFLGYSKDGILALDPEGVMGLIHPDDRDMIAKRIAMRQAGGSPSPSIRYRVVAKDGSIRWAEQRTVQFEYKGTPAIVNTYLDVTKQVEVEEAQERHGEEMRELSNRLRTVREDERTAVARAIHDDVGQLLTAQRLDLSWVMDRIPEVPEGIRKKLGEVIEGIDAGIKTVQRLSRRLRPPLLDDLGLSEAIRWELDEFSGRTDIEIKAHLGDMPSTDPGISIALFRICQEALTNVARHSGATRIEVTLRVHDGDIRLTVSDNGIGISAMQIGGPRSLGLIGMREEARAIDGRVEFRGEPDRGTDVVVTCPVKTRFEPLPDVDAGDGI